MVKSLIRMQEILLAGDRLWEQRTVQPNNALHRSPVAPVTRPALKATRPPGAGAGELKR